MDIGVGLDPTLGLDLEQQFELSRESARLGFQSIWTCLLYTSDAADDTP